MKTGAQSRWHAIRALFEKYGAPSHLIATISGLTTATVEKRSTREGWSTSMVRDIDVLARLNDALFKQVAEIEAELGAGEGADEKSVRTLGTLARTWEKLMELEKGMENSLEKPAAANGTFQFDEAHLHELRSELERRIGVLVAQKSDVELSEKPQSQGDCSSHQ